MSKTRHHTDHENGGTDEIDVTGLTGAGGGSVATDTIFDAKGDLAVGTGADTAAKLTAGANDTILMADSAQSTGLKWVASDTPSTQDFGDAAAVGTADTFTRGDHKHGMPANPFTTGASSKASGSGDVTTTSSLADVTGATLSLTAGTYIVTGIFDTLVNNALNDRTWEGHLDVGGADENDYAQLNAPGLVNVRATIAQSWRIVLGGTTTVKLTTKHSGGTVGDFTVKSTNTTITAYMAGGGAPTDVDYLVGTASGNLSAEIVVGTTPGGELGGTWASPTVDATHSGSQHVLADRIPSSPGTYDEEFNGTADTLPTNWAWTSAPSGSDEWKLNSRWPSLLTVEGTGNTDYTLSRTSFTAASTFGLWAKIIVGPAAAADKAKLRLYVMNSGSTEGRCMELRISAADTPNARALKTVSSVESVVGAAKALGAGQGLLYVGITRDGSNNFSHWYSKDGLQFTRITTAESHTFTIDRFVLTMGTHSYQSFVACDWVRYRTDNAFPRP